MRPILARDSDASAPARLPFLDGLRGLAAAYVVLHHAAVAVPPSTLSGAGLVVRFLLRHGRYAVAVFIVLSGYCLMRPVASDPAGRLRGGFLGYLGRRARRILPPYYAALVLCCLLIAAVPALGHPPRTWWDRAVPAFGPGTIASHLLLAHNLSAQWLFKIDPPAWSVATEWQIYLLFPVLLTIWRRWGMAAAVAAGFAVGYGVACLADPLGNAGLRQCCPWYAGLFATGMAAALAARAHHGCLAHGPRADPPVPPLVKGGSESGRTRVGFPQPRWRAGKLPPLKRGGAGGSCGAPPRSVRSPDVRRSHSGVPACAFGVLAIALAGLALAGHDDRAHLVGDPLVGLATAVLLVRCTRLATSGGAARISLGRFRRVRCADRPRDAANSVRSAQRTLQDSGTSPGLRILQSRVATALGAVSYSLYLVHYPLLAWADARLRSFNTSGDARLATHLLATAPLCLLAAWLFHQAFERPFLVGRGRATAPSVHVPSPARRRTNDAPVPTATRM